MEPNMRCDQQEKIKLQLQVINALGNEYSTLYLIDCSTKEWSIFKSSSNTLIKNILDKIATCADYETAFNFYIDKYVVDEDKEYLRNHIAIECLMEETPDIGIHSLNYDRMFNGARQHVQINSAKFKGDDGKSYIVLGFRDVHDIIEKQMKQEEALREALMSARHANRAKTTFLSNMSHDIRTPMNAIMGYAALAEAHIENTAQVQDYLKKIRTSSAHLLSLINEILDMSRIESGAVKLEENIVHIPDVLNDLRAMIQGQIASRQQNLHIDAKSIAHEDVITDKLRLNQILLNLVSNAIKYTGVGGNIYIRVQDKPCQISGRVSYEFSVKDTGIGMSPEFIDHIFDTFSRERSSTVSGIEGSGLGLSITKSIVDLMNGNVTVHSELGKGSEFIVNVDFKLPEQNHAVEEKSKKAGVGASVAKTIKMSEFKRVYNYNGKRILLVEDNELNREIASTLLADAGFIVDEAADGIEAVSIIYKAPEDKYDLIFMDIQMPKMDGYMATREIRTLQNNKKANIPIVAMTANAFEEDRRKAFTSGMNGHIAKPIDMKSIAKVLDTIFTE